jgi:Chalcone isomerase-like
MCTLTAYNSQRRGRALLRRAAGWLAVGGLCASMVWPSVGAAQTATTTASTQAAPDTALKPPADVLGVLPGATLRGQADLRFFGLKIYSAKLWAAAPFNTAQWEQQSLAIDLQYARTISGDDLATRSMDEIKRSGALSDAQASTWLAFMKTAFPNVRPGDRITGVWAPARNTTTILVNGVRQAALEDAAFGKRFFGIWLASTTSEPAMRAALLGVQG